MRESGGGKEDGRRKTAELLFRFQALLHAALKRTHLGGKITGFHKSATVSHFRADATKASTQTPSKKKEKLEPWRKWMRASNGMLSWSPKKEELFATHLSTASYQIMSLQFTLFLYSSTPSPPSFSLYLS